MAKDTFFERKPSLRVRGRLLDLTEPRVMGILNITPDSFYSGSRLRERSGILQRAERMWEEGADILDIGGYSSRPGAEHISEEEERERAIPAIRAVREALPEAVLSVDSFRASIAAEAVEEGADMVNDISAGLLDPAMLDQVAELQVPYVLMHMPGTPQDMQKRTQYRNVTAEVFHFLSERLQRAREKGINDVVLDPGFGFGKELEQNYTLLRDLESFTELGAPLLVGVSRKSMITRLLECSSEEALNGSTVLHVLARQRGADIFRVHDVKEAKEALRILKFEGNAASLD